MVQANADQNVKSLSSVLYEGKLGCGGQSKVKLFLVNYVALLDGVTKCCMETRHWGRVTELGSVLEKWSWHSLRQLSAGFFQTDSF